MNKMVQLKFHRKRCTTCKYYKYTQDEHTTHSQCVHPDGRSLTIGVKDQYADHARYCSEWTSTRVSIRVKNMGKRIPNVVDPPGDNVN